MISSAPPYATQRNMIKIIENLFSLWDLTRKVSHKKDKEKKIDACTNLSKLNNSSQLVVGIYCPGVQHNINMMRVHKMAAVKLCFKSSFSIFCPTDNAGNR